jgi:hypothetical protein
LGHRILRTCANFLLTGARGVLVCAGRCPLLDSIHPCIDPITPTTPPRWRSPMIRTSALQPSVGGGRRRRGERRGHRDPSPPRRPRAHPPGGRSADPRVADGDLRGGAGDPGALTADLREAPRRARPRRAVRRARRSPGPRGVGRRPPPGEGRRLSAHGEAHHPGRPRRRCRSLHPCRPRDAVALALEEHLVWGGIRLRREQAALEFRMSDDFGRTFVTNDRLDADLAPRNALVSRIGALLGIPAQMAEVATTLLEAHIDAQVLSGQQFTAPGLFITGRPPGGLSSGCSNSGGPVSARPCSRRRRWSRAVGGTVRNGWGGRGPSRPGPRFPT